MHTKARLNLILILVLAIAGCKSVAITGRTQLNFVSDKQLTDAANANFDKLINAANEKNAVLQASESAEAARIIASVNSVSNKIIDAAGLRNQYNWQVVILKSNVPNAFVMPNGKIVVYTGILPIAKNEAGMAAIIGHETAHVVAHHASERLSQAKLAEGTIKAAAVAVAVADAAVNKNGNKPRAQTNAIILASALGIGAQYGVLLPFSRQHESEADRIGQIYMAKAGYDPSEAIAVWERMAARKSESSFEFLSTHPSDVTRQKDLREWLPDARLYFTDSKRPLPINISELTTARIRKADEASLAPMALMPKISPGSWFKLKNPSEQVEYHAAVERYEPCEHKECFSLTTQDGRKTIITQDYKIVAYHYPDGTWVKHDPPIPQLQFPIKVGQSWDVSTIVKRSNGQNRSIQIRGEVAEYSKISVLAGDFFAYKIVTIANGKRIEEKWFSPEAKTFIQITNYSNPNKPLHQELTAISEDNSLDTSTANGFYSDEKYNN